MTDTSNRILEKIKSNIELGFRVQGVIAEVEFINDSEFSVTTHSGTAHKEAQRIMLLVTQTPIRQTINTIKDIYISYYGF